MIFVDSDAYISLYIINDKHHKATVLTADWLKSKSIQMATSWDVIDEVATKLCYLSGKKVANRFLDRVGREGSVIAFPDASKMRKAVKLFQRQPFKRISMTDCMNMVIARELKIKTFFSFDNHYRENGFTLLPYELGIIK